MPEGGPTVPETFRKLVALLEGEKIPFVLIGGLAASLQGEPRTTRDVDVMVLLHATGLRDLALRAKEAGFDVDIDLAESQWWASGFARFWLGPPDDRVAVDLMDVNNEFLREAHWRAVPIRFCGRKVSVVSPEDLILMKIVAWRDKDILDIRRVEMRHRDRLDVAYLRKWVAWFAAESPRFSDVPGRLEDLLSGRELPPPKKD
jgi:predicted nucleotidyltransferase